MTAVHVIAEPRPALVGIDALTHEAAEGNLWGYASHISDWHWNGWAVPFFTRAEVERIDAQAAEMNAGMIRAWGDDALLNGGCRRFTWDGDVLSESDPMYPEEPAVIVDPSFLPDGTPVYSIGDGFCWQEVDTTAEIPLQCRAVLA